MSATDISICSNALLMTGAKPINDFSENSDRARLVSNLYPMVRDYVIRSHPWKCCTKRDVLSPDVDAPAFDWAYQYTLPADFVKPLSVGEYGAEDEFKIEGRKLLCDSNPLYLRYVFRNTNPGTWDDGLVYAVTMSMKQVIAYPITQSASLEQLVNAELQPLLKQQRAIDGQDQTPDTFGDFRLLRSRFARSDILSQ
jgi:hypothetical protein